MGRRGGGCECTTCFGMPTITAGNASHLHAVTAFGGVSSAEDAMITLRQLGTDASTVCGWWPVAAHTD